MTARPTAGHTPAYELTLAGPEAEEAIRKSSGSDGHDPALAGLDKHPLAKAEIEKAIQILRRRRKAVDHIHFYRVNGTDYVQWMGRFGDGRHYPLGRAMQLVKVQP